MLTSELYTSVSALAMLFTRLLVAISSLRLSFGPRSSDLDFLEVFAGRARSQIVDHSNCVGFRVWGFKAIIGSLPGEHVLFSAAKLYGLRAHGIDDPPAAISKLHLRYVASALVAYMIYRYIYDLR